MKNSPSSPPAPCLAILGTGSEVGKSIVTTALCRYFHNQGRHTAPFKAQNMSNNSGVTPEGLEMGRAQIVQAEAARIPPHVDMNPILLKPTTDVGCQVVLEGRAEFNTSATGYHAAKEALFSTACKALDRLRRTYDLIVMEGAGSCAEVNLLPSDIVNFRMAEYAQTPVILVADIHRGGVFAQIVGTLACIPEAYRKLLAGFIINRFRGDIRLFTEGMTWIEAKTGLKGLGVLPWYSHFRIEAEDSVVIESPQKASPQADRSAVAVLRIPHISNFTDFDPLSAVDGLSLYFLENVQDISRFKAVIIPGSKNTRFDLQWVFDTGWADRLKSYAAGGGHVLGICGGYQMMGRWVHDPDGVEGTPGKTPGLDFLPVETFMIAPKTTTLTEFRWQGIEGRGYEIHMGQTRHHAGAEHMLEITARNSTACQDVDGCLAPGGRCMGTYLHGLFDAPGITRLWLDHIGVTEVKVSEIHGPAARDRDYDLLAAHAAQHLDMAAIERVVFEKSI